MEKKYNELLSIFYIIKKEIFIYIYIKYPKNKKTPIFSFAKTFYDFVKAELY